VKTNEKERRKSPLKNDISAVVSGPLTIVRFLRGSEVGGRMPERLPPVNR
jgi:hypothetical protein